MKNVLLWGGPNHHEEIVVREECEGVLFSVPVTPAEDFGRFAGPERAAFRDAHYLRDPRCLPNIFWYTEP